MSSDAKSIYEEYIKPLSREEQRRHACSRFEPGGKTLQYPHLSLAQIHAALSFYHQHKTEMEAEIQKCWLEVNELSAQESESPLHQRLREIMQGLYLEP